MALRIDIAANTRQAQKDVKDLGKSLDTVSDSLDDVARDSDKAAGKLESSFRDMVRASEKTGRDIGRNMDDGFDKAKQGADEFKDEANSTAKEAAASFDGSAESIGDAFQEVAANAFAGFGPAGAAAGLLIAAGIGAGTAALQNLGDLSEEQKERIKGHFQEMADSGIAAWSSMESFQKRLSDAYSDHEAEIQAISDTYGIAFETVAAAWAGNKDAVAQVEAAAKDYLGSIADDAGVSAEALERMHDNANRFLDPLRQANDEYDVALEKAKRYEEQVAQMGETERAQIQRTRDADQARYEALAERYANPIPVKFKPDTSSLDAWLRNYRPTVYSNIVINPNGMPGRTLP